MQRYESRRILGKLYKLVSYNQGKVRAELIRQIKSEPHFVPTDIRIDPQKHIDPRLAKYKLPSSYLTHAYKLKQ